MFQNHILVNGMKKIQLTKAQKEYFNENGFLIVEKVLEDGDLQDVIDELNAEIDIRAKKLVEHGDLSKLYRNESFETRLARISSETPKLAVPKGGVLHLSNKVIHGSFKNSTDGVRWSMDLRYQSAEIPMNADISRLENETREDLKSGVPSACYPPDADFLVRSAKREKEIIASYEEFHKLRETFMGKPVTNRFGVSWGEMTVEDV